MSAKCLNCNTSYTGKFCPECGQKASTHRFTFAAILHDIPHSVFHIDKGLFFTFAQLTYRPGRAIREYLEGKRIRHFSPFAYLLILSAASSFVRHLTLSSIHDRLGIDPSILFPKAAEFFDHYPALMLCLLVPFLSFWGWLFNRDKQYNYWEVFILNTYLVAQFNLFFIIHNLLRLSGMYHSNSVTPLLICFISYFSFAHIQFFWDKRSLKRTIKNVLLIVLMSFTLMTGLTLTGFMTPWWNTAPRHLPNTFSPAK
ncbi:MAG: hypothetical protein K0Q79_2183 [Flavipsychrobacter sp.]|jgi:hypothetical protein|nr:hypothetical protein [Flavipsychrobacter sp.]